MDAFIDLFRNPWIMAYLGLLVFGQWAVTSLKRASQKARADRRKKAGLTDETLADPASQLKRFRSWTFRHLMALLALGVGFPIVVLILEGLGVLESTDGLLVAFVTVMVFAVWGSTDVAKSWLGGVAFQTLVAARRPFQIGDRVSLKGHSGKVISIDAWHIQLQTADDDLVSIPTASLWGETLVSANAGDRSSLVVIELHLDPDIDKGQRREAEDFLWDAISASSYLDPSKPMQIFLEQTRTSIVLRGKAYVGSTYLEAMMRSDVTSAFLDYAADECIPLAKRQP